ncbi:MAG: putative repeat protein (TIGR04042 family) [Pseudohongiellaceae bacterium]|jgi:uncharacterized repeat protein (TIGR04042 family)
MPETYFEVRWPDGQQQTCYSPSSIVREYFEADKQYTLGDFVHLSETSLGIASERVKQKFGYYCSSAADQLKQIKQKADEFDGKTTVMVIGFRN